MASIAFRWSIRGRPPPGLGSSGGSSGCIRSQSSSGIPYRASVPLSAIGHLSFNEMLDAINRGIQRVRRDKGIIANIRIDLVRNFGPDSAMIVLDWIEEKPDNIVSVDIGGSEYKFPPRPFAPVFERAKDMSLHLVAHAGEAAGPKSVWDAIKYLGVERIGHGTSVIHDTKLQKYLKKKGIALEQCITSNYLTGSWPNEKPHPFGELYKKGVPVTLNSDDPSIQDSNLTDDYMKAIQYFGLTLDDLAIVNKNALKSTFISEDEKNKLEMTYFDKLNQFKNEHGL